MRVEGPLAIIQGPGGESIRRETWGRVLAITTGSHTRLDTTYRASPKSASFIHPLCVIKMLLGLMSRCMRPDSKIDGSQKIKLKTAVQHNSRMFHDLPQMHCFLLFLTPTWVSLAVPCLFPLLMVWISPEAWIAWTPLRICCRIPLMRASGNRSEEPLIIRARSEKQYSWTRMTECPCDVMHGLLGLLTTV